MKKAIENHIEGITPEALEAFKEEAFISFASANVGGINSAIGVNGAGKYIVKFGDHITRFNNVDSAIAAYKYIFADYK